MFSKCHFISFLLLVFSLGLRAQTDTVFWFAAPDVNTLAPSSTAPLADRPINLRMASFAQSANVKISIPSNPGFTPIVVPLSPNSAASVDLTPYIDLIENGVVNTAMNKGLLITSTAPITCYYDIVNSRNGDIFALKGRNAIGKKFTIPFQMRFMNRPTDNPANTNDIIIVATEDNTRVTVSPRSLFVGQPVSGSFSFNLNRGETYVLRAQSNLPADRPGGTIVSSDKPVSITIKDDLMQYTGEACADTGGDQLIPDELAGNEFILIRGRFANATGNLPDYYYVFATEDGTEIKVDGAVQGVYKAGEYFTGILSNDASLVESSRPVQVFHIAGFGCEIGAAVIPSAKCTGSSQINFTRASSGEEFFMNILAPTSIISDFKVNVSSTLLAAGAFQPVLSSNGRWSFARVQVPAALLSGGSSIIVENSKGKFHMGVIQGGRSSTARYGYFSDFAVNSISLIDPSNPGSEINPEQVICNNGNVNLVASNKEATSYVWSGPAGFNSTGSTLQINGFKSVNAGVYTVATTGNACGNASKSITLAIDKPEADFSFTSNGCEDEGVVITTSANAGVRWQWNLGGKLIDTNRAVLNPIVLGKSGSVDISLKVGSLRGCFSDEKVKTVQLSSKPKAIYQVVGNSCINDQISFRDVSTIASGNISKWRWNLDDGNGFSEQTISSSVQKRYNQWGKRDVRLVVESSTGCISDTFRLSNFMVNPLPVPGFVVPEICLDDAVAVFRDTSRSVDGYSDFSYRWDFNAGATPITPAPLFATQEITMKNPSVTYRSTGKYEIKMVVNSRGCVDSITQTFRVNGANPLAAFDVLTPLQLCSNDSVRIENRSTVGIDDVTRLEVLWNATESRTVSITTTDETPTLGKRYAIRYPNFQSPLTKEYTVTLTAYSGNAQACRKSVSKVVTINASPKVGFTSLVGICIDAAAKQITQASFDPLVPGVGTYSGLGVNTNGLFDPKIAGAGTHTITYTYVSTAQAACIDSAKQSITVWPMPMAGFTISPITCEKNPITFTSNSIAGAGTLSKWMWDFGDGTLRTQTASGVTGTNTVVHIYNSYNSYTPTLIVETSNGCKSASASINVKVNALPKPGFVLPEVCLPTARAVFTGTTSIPDNSVLGYRWFFDDPLDNSGSVTKDGVHVYRSLGNYNVKVIVTSANGCVDSLTQLFVGVYPQPKAGFSSADSACLGTAIQFRDTGRSSRGIFTEWYWDLGDKTREAKKIFSHTYNSAGSYTVSLYAKTSIGCFSDTVSKTLMIFDYPVVDAGPDLFVLDDGQKQIKASASGASLVYRWSPSIYLSDSTILNPYIVKPQDSLIYTLRVVGRGGCIAEDKMKMIPLKLPTPPNTFTPNGDGVNDRWEILYLDQYEGCIVEIYAPTGLLLYQSTGYTAPWTGNYNGKPLHAGTYYYVIDPKNNRKKITGYITLFR